MRVDFPDELLGLWEGSYALELTHFFEVIDVQESGHVFEAYLGLQGEIEGVEGVEK